MKNINKFGLLLACAASFGSATAATITVTPGFTFLNQGFTTTTVGVSSAAVMAVGTFSSGSFSQFGSSVAINAGSFVGGAVNATEPASFNNAPLHVFIGNGTTVANSAQFIILAQTSGTTFPASVLAAGNTTYNLTAPSVQSVVASQGASIATAGTTQSIAFIPEPSSALLGALGVLGLLRRRRN